MPIISFFCKFLSFFAGDRFLFSTAIFLASFLLFLIQPMAAKMTLPNLGGAPTVWITSMVFFQTMLFLGYLYSHFSIKLLGVGRQKRFHIVLAIFSPFFLRLGFPDSIANSASSYPIWWLFRELFLSLGFPLFIIAATSPLLQLWFSFTQDLFGRDPYFLFQAGNIGSMAALLCYPTLIEPNFPLSFQTNLWIIGFVILILLLILCALRVTASQVSNFCLQGQNDPIPPLPLLKKVKWVLFSFIPSSLMLGVTNFITTDLAPIPLLWIIPLTLYLLSFIVVFSRKSLIPNFWFLTLLTVMLPMFIPIHTYHVASPLWLIILYHLTVFFLISVQFHGAIAEERPPTFHLTNYYLLISFGGLMGGQFNGIIAPLVFNQLTEYPVIYALAFLLVPVRAFNCQQRSFPRCLAFLSLGLNFFLIFESFDAFSKISINPSKAAMVFTLIFMNLVSYFFPKVVTIALATVFAVLSFNISPSDFEVKSGRSFFGVFQIFRDENSTNHRLIHGTTNHGGQFLQAPFSRKPLFYYYTESPIGQVFKELNAKSGMLNVGIVGLGTGGLAAYARSGDRFTFYEIDPLIVEIANNTEYFTYLKDCLGSCSVELGDGRISLKSALENHFDLIILDAYSSDFVPVHLLTKEAVQMYFRKLKKGGILAFHISNRYLNLEPVLGNLARAGRYRALTQLYDPSKDSSIPKSIKPCIYKSKWVIITRYKFNFGNLPNDDRWKAVKENREIPQWTDDYTSILKLYHE
ncbi:fused MFS/spermidine synthase [bacterium]|nr:fused MFS/spermidine synthase [bacterium]